MNPKRLFAPILVLLAAAALSGCFSRQLVRFGTHSEKPVVLLETIDTNDYVLWSDREHVFWSCSEQGESLSCSRRCGGDTDLKCPQFAVFQDAVGTNVR